MKKFFLAFALLGSVVVFATGRIEVNEKILKSFKETFSYAEDVIWMEKDNIYQANFWQGQINIRAKYDEQGNLLSTIRYYFEKQLPPNIVSRLKKNYPGKSIFGVTEISSEDDLTYYITMQDDKNWYTIKSDVYGNSQQTEKFKKADTE